MIELQTFLREKTIFKGLTGGEINRIVGIAGIREYKRNEVIFLEGEPGDCFYLVLSGEIRIYKLSPDGREKTLAVIGMGDFFGEMALIESKARSASAGTLTGARLAVLHRDHFNELVCEHPEIALKMIVQLAERLRRANQQIESLAFQDVRERLIQFILQSAAVAEDGSCAVERKVTHQEIANLIGSSRESVTRMLGQLQDDDYIMFDGKIIVIKDRDRLERLLQTRVIGNGSA